ncbi:MAG: hypothetical protein KKF56_04840 [Nanoarchaeota archaeon]|nr:hypothetical protein [Nanoarchaeota archaeon]
MSFQNNVKGSFHRAKEDIKKLQEDFMGLKQGQQMVAKILEDIQKDFKNFRVVTPKPVVTERVVVKTVKSPTAKKTYIAAKEGKKFHEKNCPYAKNIQPKNSVKFNTKDSALNKGYKACRCV